MLVDGPGIARNIGEVTVGATASVSVLLTATVSNPAEARASALKRAPVAVSVQGVDKAFRMPHQRYSTLKERALHPFATRNYDVFEALRDVTFEVKRGEFFGIVGRNGSGKSTLLKCLAGIYRADTGAIYVNGRVSTFIELGVGFNPDLAARDNVLLNGVMLGLSPREARDRYDQVIEFAELREFEELKLKNYSSGMMVRLAFAVMVQADADIMLIDEVLAVGDASFAQKCMDVFHEKRRAGKTIVLVTHDMSTVQSLCHRAMLIDGGELQYIGDPEEAAMRYYRMNFGGVDAHAPGDDRRAVPGVNARLVEAWLENESGERVENVEQGEPIRLTVVIEAREELADPVFGIHFLNAEGATVFGFNTTLTDGKPDRIAVGRQIRIAGTIENPLVPGRYYVNCWVYQEGAHRAALQAIHLPAFVVFGTDPGPGVVSVRNDVSATAEQEAVRD
jgi:ABC-type polysaccharide/polyol phosphate transport system ATPase subunit